MLLIDRAAGLNTFFNQPLNDSVLQWSLINPNLAYTYTEETVNAGLEMELRAYCNHIAGKLFRNVKLGNVSLQLTIHNDVVTLNWIAKSNGKLRLNISNQDLINYEFGDVEIRNNSHSSTFKIGSSTSNPINLEKIPNNREILVDMQQKGMHAKSMITVNTDYRESQTIFVHHHTPASFIDQFEIAGMKWPGILITCYGRINLETPSFSSLSHHHFLVANMEQG